MLRLAGGLVAVLIAGTAGLARYFLRGILRVTRTKDYDIPVLALGNDLASGSERASENRTVQLVATEDSLLPGTYGLSWLDGPGNPTGQAIVGPILSVDGDLGGSVKRGRTVQAAAGPVVTRTLVGVRAGELRVGLRTAWEQYAYLGDPGEAHGLEFLDLELPGDLGAYPTWLLPGDGGSRWVVAVHGRGASRGETMRILPTLAALGLPTLIPSYRNDIGAPATADNRYRLGDTEWQEIDAAMAYAIENGATELVLYGWSMGAAIVLQATVRSSRADSVIAMILDSPVIDWRDTLRANARVNRLPRPAAELGLWMVQRQLGIHLDDFDWVARADELTRPMLIFHGPEDAFVPWERALALAKARPDLVSMVTYQGAGHTKSWNVDPEGYQREVRDFLLGLSPDPA
ncbi:MAG: alpha/beta fold hydrolase [Geodermatophilaceae bacterium]|nr:alpha/beta fold hydrolase [Geodermatophilaceae bacterium]